MEQLRPALHVLSRRFLRSLGGVALRDRADLVAVGVALLVLWRLCGGGSGGRVSMLWVPRVGALPVDDSRAFAFDDRPSCPRLAAFVRRLYRHGFWLPHGAPSALVPLPLHRARNENALSVQEGGRLRSAYHTTFGEPPWILTDADRSVTPRLLPRAYDIVTGGVRDTGHVSRVREQPRTSVCRGHNRRRL